MTKPINLKITLELPENHNAARIEIDAKGFVRILDNEGNLISPTRVQRTTEYARPKGPKIQSQHSFNSCIASVGGLEELADLDSFIVIDTNTARVGETNVSVAFFIPLKLIREEKGYRTHLVDGCSHAYEFHDVVGNPEMLAILKVASDITQHQGRPKRCVAFINDSSLGDQEKISAQELPVYGGHFLPDGFIISYAGDSGSELLNKIIRACDGASRRYIERLRASGVSKIGLHEFAKIPGIRYRYTFFPDAKIINPVITGTAISPGTTYQIHFE